MPVQGSVLARAVLVVALGMSLALGIVAATRPMLQITATLAAHTR
jgi:hypothetical protein